MNIGRRKLDLMDNPLFTIHTYMVLHAKIPLIAFLGLMHLWITLTIVILSRRRSGYVYCIHNRSHYRS